VDEEPERERPTSLFRRVIYFVMLAVFVVLLIMLFILSRP